jgi:hypothetical protein
LVVIFETNLGALQMKVIAISLALSGVIIAALVSPVSAGNMSGKPGGRNTAHYDQPNTAGKNKTQVKIHKAK